MRYTRTTKKERYTTATLETYKPTMHLGTGTLKTALFKHDPMPVRIQAKERKTQTNTVEWPS